MTVINEQPASRKPRIAQKTESLPSETGRWSPSFKAPWFKAPWFKAPWASCARAPTSFVTSLDLASRWYRARRYPDQNAASSRHARPRQRARM